MSSAASERTSRVPAIGIRVAHRKHCICGSQTSIQSLRRCTCIPSFYTSYLNTDGKTVKGPRARTLETVENYKRRLVESFTAEEESTDWRSVMPDAEFPMLGYAVHCREASAVKIGISKDPVARFSGLQTGNPFALEMTAVWASSEVQEAWLHEQFAEWSLRGEWFHVDGAVADFLRYVEREYKY